MSERGSTSQLDAARNGDVQAFTDLIRTSDEQMRALAYSILRDRDAMDDALQTAYLKAFRKLHDFRGDAQFSTWLYSIVYRTCIDELRTRRPTVDIDVAERIADTAPDLGDRIGDAQALASALDRLPASQRAAVLLVDAEGLSFEEAAEVLGVPIGTLGSRLSRARTALRQMLSLADQPEDER